MSNELLQLCRNHLARVYRERLGYELGQDLSKLATDMRPVWLLVAGSDLVSERKQGEESVGLLLDPEVGLLLYMVPFGEATRMSSQVNWVLKIRSQLSREHNYSAEPVADSDPFGAWRVSICWLVPARAGKGRWLEQMIAIRRGTMFAEEVSMDAVFFENGQELPALQKHGFPGLLLCSRQILLKSEAAEIGQWMRADNVVRTALAGFVDEFESEAQQGLARDVLRELENLASHSQDVPSSPALPVTEFESLRIMNFRNLAEVDLNFGSGPVTSTVIHGPNGTGKSSVCEALSIALFGSSFRYCRFADKEKERDLTTTNRAREYVTEYLTGIDTKNVEPKLSVNGAPPQPVRLVSPDMAAETGIAMSGTILTQDTSLEFARMQADELAAHVLRNYSETADRIETFVEERYSRANSARQEFLRSLSLPASITLLDTAYPRIAAREVDRFVPGSVEAHVGWLSQLLRLKWKGSPQVLDARWREWSGEGKRSSLAERVGAKRAAAAMSKEIGDWLKDYNSLVEQSAQLVYSIKLELEENRLVLPSAEAKLRILIEWRLKRPSSPDVLPSAEAAEMTRQLDELKKRQQKITEAGQDARVHLDHLTQVEAFVLQRWAKEHPADCPTCGTDLQEKGGIARVVSQLKAKVGTDRDHLLADFAALKEEIEALQKKLSTFGLAQCPLSNDELAELSTGLQWLLPADVTLDQCLDNEPLQTNLLALIRTVSSVPPVPQAVDAEDQAERLVHELLQLFQNAEAIFEAPDNWKPVKQKLTETLARVVSEHLPGTIAGLWVELAMNLTAAAWLLPDRPSIQVVTHRGGKKSTLRVKNRLVRYILNQSEIHVLGLAWFFTRYLTHGRFQHACLVMDDPAQEMDQTTYRELCRLLETWCRLHRIYGRPLKLVMLMNQESRALDAARATGGLTHLLGWVPEQKNTVSTLNVVTPGFFAPQPSRLFEPSASPRAS